ALAHDGLLAIAASRRRASVEAEQPAGARARRAVGRRGMHRRLDRHRGAGDRVWLAGAQLIEWHGVLCGKKPPSTHRNRDDSSPEETVEKREQLYRGKAKTVYATDDPDLLWLTFRNDTSAFDGQKVAQLERKGEVNNKINAFVMGRLEALGVRTHFVR